MRGIFRSGFRLFRGNFLSILGFEFFFKTLVTAVLYPFLVFAFQLWINREGYTYVVTGELLSLLKNPWSVGVFLLVFLLMAALTLYEYLVIVFALEMSRRGEKVSVAQLFSGGFRHIPHLFRPLSALLSMSVVLGTFVLELPIILVLLSSSEIAYQVKNILEMEPVLFVVGAFGVLLVLLFVSLCRKEHRLRLS